MVDQAQAETAPSTRKPRRTRKRRPRTSTSSRSAARSRPATIRRRPPRGKGLIGDLNRLVDRLILENQDLKKQVKDFQQRGAGLVEELPQAVRSIEQRVRRALGGGPRRGRRRGTSRRTTTARKTPARRRRRAATK